MKDIQEIVNQKVQSMILDGVIQEAIESGVSEAIERALKNQFERYGSITKQIESALADGLKINAKDLPFESYNAQMLVAIKTKMGNMFQSQASDHFLAEMDKLLAPVTKDISINELVETIAEIWKTDEPWAADDLDESASVELEKENSLSMDVYNLRMWKKKESSSSYSLRSASPDIQLYIIDGAIRINHSHHYNPTCFDEHEAYIFKLYAAKTIITGLEDFDPDDCDLVLKDDF